MPEIAASHPKRALIATLLNEAGAVEKWWSCLGAQTDQPDEIVIVDGGSRDGTWEKLQSLATKNATPVRLEQRRCNIAEGRNCAIRLTDAEIIVSTDAGSFPDANWFRELTRPLLEDPTIDIVGGRTCSVCETPFQKYLRLFEPAHDTPQAEGAVFSSSRNIAYRKKTWEAVGGYPEWLTLAAEDALFNYELHAIGMKFVPNPQAIVHWPERSAERDYLRLLYRNGFGAAEAKLYTSLFLQKLLIVLLPPLLLLSRHRFSHLRFRYLRSFSAAMGWLAGKLRGKRPPPGWQRQEGVLLSPEAQRHLKEKT
ncbi:MAG TPA: glycosyltransferase [Chthoniobacter sp.]|jgi:glycosyltransferase involved in cell wall biosynthesis